MTSGVALATRIAAATFAAALLAACGTTAYDTRNEPTTTLAGVTTTLPTGAPEELLARLQVRVFDLGNAIVSGGDADDAVIADIDALWAAVLPQLSAADDDFEREVQYQIDRMHHAVERRRPADADKAARLVSALIGAHLGAGEP